MQNSTVHCKKSAYDVYVGRPSKWGNPFAIGRDGTRDQVIAKYRNYILNSPQLLAQLGELKGKTLGCWCSPKACHGDVLAELANTPPEPECTPDCMCREHPDAETEKDSVSIVVSEADFQFFLRHRKWPTKESK